MFQSRKIANALWAGVALVVTSLTASPVVAQCQERLGEGPAYPFQEPGANDQIFSAATWDPDGTGYQHERLVVGGLFTSIGGIAAQNIAYWDGANWFPMGQTGGSGTIGVNGLVYDIIVYNNELYIAGAFTTSTTGTTLNHIAKYNPTTHAWLAVGSGFNGDVLDLEIFNGELFAGGRFTASGVTSISHIAKLSGSAWVALAGGGTTGDVYALQTYSLKLYVGGQFTSAGGSTQRRNLAAWDATNAWTNVGRGTDNIVTALGDAGGRLAVGGAFNNVFSSTGTAIASPGVGLFVPGGTSGLWISGVAYPGGQCYAFLLSDNLSTLYASGIGGTNLCYALNGSTWQPVGSGYTGTMVGNTLVKFDGEVHMGGLFPNMITGPGLHNLARLHAGQWKSVNPRINGSVRCFMPFGSSTWAGGDMEETTDTYGAMSGTATWNGSAIGSLGSVAGSVYSMFYSSNGIQLGITYVAGTFNAAGGVGNLNNIVAYGPLADQWAAVGTGFTANPSPGFAGVFALAGYGSTGGAFPRPILHAAGHFDVAGGNFANNIAKLVSGVWQPLGSGLTMSDSTHARVNCLLNMSGNLVAAGTFDLAGGIACNSIAKWNGSAWNSFGAGFLQAGPRGTVNAIANFNGQLVAAGRFDSSGGSPLRNLALWNGASWQDMTAGIPTTENDEVSALGVYDGQLFAGVEHFNFASSMTESTLYRWTGSSWLPSTAPVDGYILALAVNQGRLNVGGSFTQFPSAPDIKIPHWFTLNCYCVADVDDGNGFGNPDNGVTLDDLLFYLGIFDAGDLRADLDNGFGTGTPDGGVTLDDLLFFLAHFDLGC